MTTITAAEYRALIGQPLTKRKPAPLVTPSCTVSAGVIEAVIPIVTVSALNVREHHHERAKRVSNERNVTTLVLTSTAAARKAIRDLELPVTVTLTRIAPRPIRDGHDNGRAALKGTCDAIAAVLGIDDGDESKVTWKYGAQEKAKEYGVRVSVTTRRTS